MFRGLGFSLGRLAEVAGFSVQGFAQNNLGSKTLNSNDLKLQILES